MLEFKNKEAVISNINKYEKICKYLSLIRLILVINLIIWVISYLSFSDNLIYLIILIVSAIVLILFLPFTNKFFNELNKYKKINEIYLIHQRRREHKFNTFTDTGIDLIDKSDYKESDLDLFGKNSLFQYLNVSKTKYGRMYLRDSLTKPQEDNIDYKNTIKELAEKEESINLEASISGFKNTSKSLDYDFLYEKLSNKIKFKLVNFIPVISFIITIVYLFLCIFKGFNPYYLVLLLVINYITSYLFLNNDIFNVQSIEYYELLINYEDVINTINNIDINTNTYKEIKDVVNKYKDSIKSCKSILNILSIRKNMIFNVLLNTLFIMNFWVLIIFNIKNKKVDGLKEIFNAIGKLECILSLSTIGIDNEVYTLGNNNDYIKGISLYHPLVKNCVDNDFNLDGGVILTGSNMSGKTTFMRTLALCVTLNNANGLVPAYEFSAPKLDIYTSLRANDMLSEGISTFYAEILRMKKINQAIKEKKCLILVDEIFKGTNAIERISASNQVIDKLKLNNQLFIISTHDFELCDNKNIINYHFNETYIDDKISFDYKIKEGKSDTKNAIYLLKMADII